MNILKAQWRHVLSFLGALSLALVYSACSPSPSSSTQSTDTYTSNNLVQIHLLLRGGNSFPRSLRELGDPVNAKLFTSLNPGLFVCPGTGRKPGLMGEIEEWTDYIYIGGLTDNALQNAAQIISPPENHNGKYGYVLFVDGSVWRLPPEQVRRLIKNPFSMATNEPADVVAYESKRITVNVPKRLKLYYPSGDEYPAAAATNKDRKSVV